MWECDVRPKDIESNPIVRKILIYFARSSFDYAKPPGAHGEEKTVKLICWWLVQIHERTGVTGGLLISMLPKKQRGRPRKCSTAPHKETPQPTAPLSGEAQRLLREHVEPLIPADSKSSLNTLYCEKVLNGEWKDVLKEASDYGAVSDENVEQWIARIFSEVSEQRESAGLAVRTEYKRIGYKNHAAKRPVPNAATVEDLLKESEGHEALVRLDY